MKAKVIPRGKINLWKILLSGAIFAVVAQIVHTISAYLTMNYYINPAYSSVWSPLMMSMEAGSFFNNFIYMSAGFGFVFGIIFAFVYALFRAAVPGKDIISKGLSYGFIIFLVGAVPEFLSYYLLINLPMLLIFYWAIEGLIIYLVMGMVVAKINT